MADTIMTSPDGVTWTLQDNPTWDSGGFGASVSANEDRIVALSVGATNPLVTSTDGVTWDAVTSSLVGGFPGFNSSSGSVRWLPELGLWVVGSIAPGDTTDTQQSDDGLSWTDLGQYAGSIPDNGPPINGFADSSIADGVFSAPINTSVLTNLGTGDPIGWASDPEPAWATGGASGIIEYYGYASDGENVVVIASWETSDGVLLPEHLIATQWSSGSWQTPQDMLAGVDEGDGGPVAGAIAYGDDMFMCLGYQPLSGPSNTMYVFSSADGSDFAPTGADSIPYGIWGLCFGNTDTWVASVFSTDGAAASIITSTDGFNSWTLQTTPLDGFIIQDICWSEALGLFIAVGLKPAPASGNWAVGTTA
jgi:hypothetical protein